MEQSIKWSKSETIGKLAAALASTQATMGLAIKDSTNPFFNSKYADLTSCWGVAREPMTGNGLCLIQLPTTDGNKVNLVTMLAHVSGEFIHGELTMLAADSKPQSIGSCISYAKRYAMCGVLGIASGDSDDDGSAASGLVDKPKPKADKPKPKAEPKPKDLREELNIILYDHGNKEHREDMLKECKEGGFNNEVARLCSLYMHGKPYKTAKDNLYHETFGTTLVAYVKSLRDEKGMNVNG